MAEARKIGRVADITGLSIGAGHVLTSDQYPHSIPSTY